MSVYVATHACIMIGTWYAWLPEGRSLQAVEPTSLIKLSLATSTCFDGIRVYSSRQTHLLKSSPGPCASAPVLSFSNSGTAASATCARNAVERDSSDKYEPLNQNPTLTLGAGTTSYYASLLRSCC